MKILLGMPSVGMIPSKTVVSLLQTAERGKVEPVIVTGSLVYDSRDQIATFAVNEGYDYVLYADSDMVFSASDLKMLLAHNTDIVSGLYVTRTGSQKNVAYKEIHKRINDPYRAPELIHDTLDTGYGKIAAVGFGFCLIRTEVLKCMFKRYKSLFEPKWGFGEDIAFCVRAKKCGYDIYIDRDVKIGHVGETVYSR